MNKIKKNKTPELLAPAGSLSSAITAFDYGADAVYAGLNKFNARERTENFSFEDMSKLLAYSNKNNKKVYITLNTLIKESEITDVFEYISQIAKLSPDAVIVQDLGVLRIIKEYFPELTIHASTQMGFHNSAGVNFASKLGIKRVILERQTTIEEIETIIKNSKLEIEVFIHGALCCSMSGNCLLSSWFGGWSGNRGKCKQPCRKFYQNENLNGYFLSTKDLYSLDIIPKLKEIGVRSLKIEGRLRKPDYVKNVVSAYRLVLDANPKDDCNKILTQAKEILSRTPGRKWSGGFRNKESFREVIEYKNLGISGQPLGNVLNIKKGGFKALISKRLHIGDRLRIQPKSGEEGPALTVTKIYYNGKDVNKVFSGQECFIPCEKEIPQNGIIYKIGESGGDITSRLKNLPLISHPIDIDINIRENIFSVKTTNIPSVKSWQIETKLEPAKNKALTSEEIINVFKATNSDSFSLGKINVNIDKNYFMPASVLKQIRRDFWTWITENLTETDLYSHIYEAAERFRIDYSKLSNFNTKSGKTESIQLSLSDKKTIVSNECVVIHSLDDFNPATNEIILPNYCFEHYLPVVKRKIRKAVSKGKKRFRITSLYQFELLKDFKDIEFCTSYPLPVCNTFAVREMQNTAKLMKAKLNHVQGWLEYESAELDKFIANSPAPIEIYNYGRPYIFVTRAFLPAKGKITDPKGKNFYVVVDSDAELAYLYPEEVLSIPNIEGTASFKDLTIAEENEEKKSTFNYNYNWMQVSGNKLLTVSKQRLST